MEFCSNVEELVTVFELFIVLEKLLLVLASAVELFKNGSNVRSESTNTIIVRNAIVVVFLRLVLFLEFIFSPIPELLSIFITL